MRIFHYISNKHLVSSFPVGTLDNIQSQPLTVDSLIKKEKLTGAQLEQEIQESDLLSLAEKFTDPSLYFDQLGLTPSKQADVNKLAMSDIQGAMSKALSLWRQMNPLEATFGKLIAIVLSRRRGDIALEICKYLNESR